ncbi:MAG: hypothetical protein DHS20C21_04110 [Gemmatimonadota bacterium]|nr:MAG: hypothetical protein DHS20C21_04110 [Gemmatimonadota bacterium]
MGHPAPEAAALAHATLSLDRPWVPVSWAVVLAALMIWMASGPFELPESTRVELEVPWIELVAPGDRVSAFPDHFEWAPVPNADYYLIGAARVTPTGTEPLFRQPGEDHQVDLEFEPGARPPAGEYLWEVFAFGPDGIPMARGAGAFVVE